MRIAFVIPWFGAELKGGAEQQAWQLATRLAKRGHQIEVLTTCCKSFMDDWSVNHLSQGVQQVSGLVVRRFHVEAREAASFHRLNAILLSLPRERLRPGLSPVPLEQARIWTDENINSKGLEAYLEANAESHDAFIFIPYLYGPTLRGLRKVAAKAWMQPCLHDEAYAYLPDTADTVYAARGLLFNSLGEQELAARLFGPAVWSKGHVTGEGIEFAPLEAYAHSPLPDAVRGRRFVLFLGRRDPGKGIDLLLDAFEHMRSKQPDSDLHLVLAGPGDRDYGAPERQVIDLGLVADNLRVALLRGCAALALPSPNESFSRVLHEAWYVGKPVMVRRSCDATRRAVEECKGGWVAESTAEWAEGLMKLAASNSSDQDLETVGKFGIAYSREMADWECVLDRYEALLGKSADEPALPVSGRRELKNIHQLSPTLAYGDAISNEMISVRNMLRASGYGSNILVTAMAPAVAHEAVHFSPDALAPDDGLIYHHSIGCELTNAAIRHPGPKALIYHNITPAEYFLPFRRDFAALLRQGREEMWALAPAFRSSAGVSKFNAEELARFGFEEPGVTPLQIEPSTWNLPPSPAWMERLSDGRKNVVFVGRFAPNKRQDRLVEAFSVLKSMVNARLVLAGSAPAGDDYSDYVRRLVSDMGLDEDVIITGHCALADLHAIFRSAHLFWSFSEHEGFCVPLVEAMWFDVPVIALSAAAVPETLKGAGLVFSGTDHDVHTARLAYRALTDDITRSRVLAQQRVRREQFRRRQVAPGLARLIARMTSSHLSLAHPKEIQCVQP